MSSNTIKEEDVIVGLPPLGPPASTTGSDVKALMEYYEEDEEDDDFEDYDETYEDVVQFMEFCEKKGFRVEEFDDYYDNYGIDFVLTRMEGVHAALSLGVRFSRFRDKEAQRNIAQAVDQGVVQKALYIEAHPEVGMAAFPIAQAMCVAYLFDARYSASKALSIRFRRDKSFTSVELRNGQRRAPGAPQRRRATKKPRIYARNVEGVITTYVVNRGFGFIESGGQSFFFHIANVEEEMLKDRLTRFSEDDKIPVVFDNAGITPGKKYPKALSVRQV